MNHYNKSQTRRLFRRLNASLAWQVGGVALLANQRWRVGHVRYAHLCDMDLSAPTLCGRFGGRGRFEGCHFVRVQLDGIEARRIDFIDCRFKGATLERFLSTFTDCRFERCEFTDCQISGALFDRCEFVDCELERMRAESATCWTHCVFRSTRLSGRLRDAAFLSGDFENCDFSRAVLLNASFADSSCFGVVLPDSRQLFAVSPQMLLGAGERLRGRLDGETLQRYEEIATTLAEATELEMVHRELFSRELGINTGELVLKTLYEMSHAEPRRSAGGSHLSLTPR